MVGMICFFKGLVLVLVDPNFVVGIRTLLIGLSLLRGHGQRIRPRACSQDQGFCLSDRHVSRCMVLLPHSAIFVCCIPLLPLLYCFAGQQGHLPGEDSNRGGRRARPPDTHASTRPCPQAGARRALAQGSLSRCGLSFRISAWWWRSISVFLSGFSGRSGWGQISALITTSKRLHLFFYLDLGSRIDSGHSTANTTPRAECTPCLHSRPVLRPLGHPLFAQNAQGVQLDEGEKRPVQLFCSPGHLFSLKIFMILFPVRYAHSLKMLMILVP